MNRDGLVISAMKLQDVQVAVASYAKAAGRQPRAIVTNQATHDALVRQLPNKPANFQMQKWRIDPALADHEIGFD